MAPGYATAVREAVHVVCREALHTAIKDITVAEGYGFPQGMPAIEGLPYGAAPQPNGTPGSPTGDPGPSSVHNVFPGTPGQSCRPARYRAAYTSTTPSAGALDVRIDGTATQARVRARLRGAREFLQ